jgi:hypothetical protein
MCRQIISIVLVAFSLLASTALAQSLPAEEQAFIDKHVTEIFSVSAKRLSDPAVTKAFSVPIYLLTLTINAGDGGTGTQEQIAARIDDKLVPVARPGTDGDCPAIQKMLNPDFTLSADANAKLLQTALDTLYPPMMSSDKKAVAFRHTGRDWIFVRGIFFDKPMGFVFTTDDKGKITAVKYLLKLP